MERRANEPCGRTVPNNIFKTLIFMENAGEIPPEEQIDRSPAVKNVLKSMLEAVGDVDYSWLEEVAREGVSLGVDEDAQGP